MQKDQETFVSEPSGVPPSQHKDKDKDRNPSWRADLNDNYCKLRRLELPPTGYDEKGKLVFAAKPVASYLQREPSRTLRPIRRDL